MPRVAPTAIVFLLGATACGSGTRGAVTRRASVTLDCPASAMTVAPIGAGGWMTEGCGRRQMYTCVGYVCSPDGPIEDTRGSDRRRGSGSETREAVVPAPTSSTPLEDASTARAALIRCAIEASARITITVSPDGSVRRVETPGLSAETGACVVTALRATRFRVRAAEEVAVVEVTAHSAERAPPVVASAAVEAAVRAAIDGLRGGILACTGGTPVAVVGEWTAGGELTIHLPSSSSGSAEEGCIRAVGSGARIDAPGAAGSILHALH